MTATVEEDLVAPLREPALERLWSVARSRLERNGRDWLGAVVVRGLMPAEQEAIGRLLGLRRPVNVDARIRLGDLDAALRDTRLALSLPEAVELVTGEPLRDLAGERAVAASAWEVIWQTAKQHPALEKHPHLEEWLHRVRRSGLLKRLVGNDRERLLPKSMDLVESMPRDGQLLSTVATEATRNPHALDPGRPLATLTLSALAHLAGEPFRSTSMQRRALWAQFGVIADELSSTVLALNLLPMTAGPGCPRATVEQLRALAHEGEPASLTLSQLLRCPMRFELPDPVVLVCENPSVMAAAKQLGPAARPMVCVFGRFNTAAATVLKYLAESGAELRYHGDFDWGGIRIANEVIQRFGALPLRYSTADYLNAVEAGQGAPTLTGNPVEAVWDIELGHEIERNALAVHEESVLDSIRAEFKAGLRTGPS